MFNAMMAAINLACAVMCGAWLVTTGSGFCLFSCLFNAGACGLNAYMAAKDFK